MVLWSHYKKQVEREKKFSFSFQLQFWLIPWGILLQIQENSIFFLSTYVLDISRKLWIRCMTPNNTGKTKTTIKFAQYLLIDTEIWRDRRRDSHTSAKHTKVFNHYHNKVQCTKHTIAQRQGHHPCRADGEKIRCDKRRPESERVNNDIIFKC